MPLNLITIFLATLVTAIILTILVRRLAIHFKIIDRPQTNSRHIHQQAVPLLGGLAIFLTFCLILIWVYFSPAWPVKKFGLWEVLSAKVNIVHLKQLIGILVAGCLLMIGGWLDDKYHLKPRQQIIWPILACLVVIASGIGINYINNPFGQGYIYFNHWKIELFKINSVPFYFTPWADLFTFVWLMLLMYSTKLLDGLDGLVSGISVIGGLVILVLSLSTLFFQPDVAVLATIFVAASFGFLLFNFYPAKIFLGEGGSLFAGFMLGTLAIISGSKIATAFLILGFPILDTLWITARRIFKERRSPFIGDKKHLHFRLLETGFSHRGAVIFLWFISLIFGLVALFIRTKGKLLMLLFLIVFMLLLGFFVVFKEKKLKMN